MHSGLEDPSLGAPTTRSAAPSRFRSLIFVIDEPKPLPSCGIIPGLVLLSIFERCSFRSPLELSAATYMVGSEWAGAPIAMSGVPSPLISPIPVIDAPNFPLSLSSVPPFPSG